MAEDARLIVGPYPRISCGCLGFESSAFCARCRARCCARHLSQVAFAKTRAAFSKAASRMNADFFIPDALAACSIICAPDSGHLNDKLAFGSSESLGLPTRSSTRLPFHVPSSHHAPSTQSPRHLRHIHLQVYARSSPAPPRPLNLSTCPPGQRRVRMIDKPSRLRPHADHFNVALTCISPNPQVFRKVRTIRSYCLVIYVAPCSDDILFGEFRMTCKHARMNLQRVHGFLYFLLLYYTTLLDHELKN